MAIHLPAASLRTLKSTAAVMALACLAGLATAQPAWPDRPIKLVVPFAPGGGSDIMARAIADKLGARLGQPMVIDNKGGAGGAVGFAAVANAAPDGNTLLFVTTAIATNPTSGAKLGYDPRKSFEPIGLIGVTPLIVNVAASEKIATLADLMKASRDKPDALAYGSGGVGSMSHLGMALLAAEAKMPLLHVPYKGMGPAMTDMLGGRIQTGMSTLTTSKPFIDDGKVRVLAVTGTQRSPFLPNVPTVAEAGVPGFQIEFWWGFMAPAGTPPAIIKRVNDELNALLAQKEIRDLLAKEAAVPKPVSPAEFRRIINFDLDRWSKLIKDANIQVE